MMRSFGASAGDNKIIRALRELALLRSGGGHCRTYGCRASEFARPLLRPLRNKWALRRSLRWSKSSPSRERCGAMLGEASDRLLARCSYLRCAALLGSARLGSSHCDSGEGLRDGQTVAARGERILNESCLAPDSRTAREQSSSPGAADVRIDAARKRKCRKTSPGAAYAPSSRRRSVSKATVAAAGIPSTCGSKTFKPARSRYDCGAMPLARSRRSGDSGTIIRRAWPSQAEPTVSWRQTRSPELDQPAQRYTDAER